MDKIEHITKEAEQGHGCNVRDLLLSDAHNMNDAEKILRQALTVNGTHIDADKNTPHLLTISGGYLRREEKPSYGSIRLARLGMGDDVRSYLLDIQSSEQGLNAKCNDFGK